MRCTHDAVLGILTGPYTEAEAFDNLLRMTGGNTDEELARLMVVQSKEMLTWIAEQGVRRPPSLGGALTLGRTNSFFLGGAAPCSTRSNARRKPSAPETAYDSEVVDLEIEGGAFTAAVIRRPKSNRKAHRDRLEARRRRGGKAHTRRSGDSVRRLPAADAAMTRRKAAPTAYAASPQNVGPAAPRWRSARGSRSIAPNWIAQSRFAGSIARHSIDEHPPEIVEPS
jgi:hypothetical protein